MNWKNEVIKFVNSLNSEQIKNDLLEELWNIINNQPDDEWTEKIENEAQYIEEDIKELDEYRIEEIKNVIKDNIETCLEYHFEYEIKKIKNKKILNEIFNLIYNATLETEIYSVINQVIGKEILNIEEIWEYVIGEIDFLLSDLH